jgi:Right handed beta helix region
LCNEAVSLEYRCHWHASRQPDNGSEKWPDAGKRSRRRTGNNAILDHVSATGIAISSATGSTVQYSNIGKSPEDGIHITSDRGSMVKNVVLSHNFIHSPKVPETAHYDGTQVRGVKGLVISCSTYDPGKYQTPFNAAIYLEDANGGNTNVSIEDNWLYGFGFSVMIDAPKTRIIGNRVGGDIHWGTCYLSDSVSVSSLRIRDNINEKTHKPEPMCSEASRR